MMGVVVSPRSLNDDDGGGGGGDDDDKIDNTNNKLINTRHS